MFPMGWGHSPGPGFAFFCPSRVNALFTPAWVKTCLESPRLFLRVFCELRTRPAATRKEGREGGGRADPPNWTEQALERSVWPAPWRGLYEQTLMKMSGQTDGHSHENSGFLGYPRR